MNNWQRRPDGDFEFVGEARRAQWMYATLRCEGITALWVAGPHPLQVFAHEAERAMAIDAAAGPTPAPRPLTAQEKAAHERVCNAPYWREDFHADG